MGRRKFRLSKLPKNVERKRKGQRSVGRPCKNPCSAGVVLHAPEPVVVHPAPEPVGTRPIPEPSQFPDVDVNDSSNSGCVLSPVTESSLGSSSFLSSSSLSLKSYWFSVF